MKGGIEKQTNPAELQANSSITLEAVNDNKPIVIQLNFPIEQLNALQRQSPRLLTRHEAACYCAIEPETFDDYRRRGILPDPINGTNRWDKKLIDQYLDRASGITTNTNSSLDDWRAQKDG